MMLIRASVKYSPIHGLGCFTEVDIKAGEVVWKLDPRLDLELDADEIMTFPEAYQHFLEMYAYAPFYEGKKTVVLCGDHARHMNHSKTPNLGESPEGHNVALRDIKAGEELTCDYTLFDGDFLVKIKS